MSHALKSSVPFHPQWRRIRERMAAARTIVDLGCGPNPVEGATVAVDGFVGSDHRGLGWNESIDARGLSRRGVRFVEARIDRPLPFRDDEFDFAYSHHAFEHLDDPATACHEMQRIAKAGVVVTPSVFAEVAFGRPYHKWYVMPGDGELFFFEKTPFDYGCFGVPLGSHKDGGYLMTEDTTPFDPALNDGDWYDGPEDFGAIRERLQWHYKGRTPVFDVVFHWSGSFRFHVVRRKGSAEGLAPWMPGAPADGG
jgi:SAM-dependent methyltransferase